jgi:hypothetical protein
MGRKPSLTIANRRRRCCEAIIFGIIKTSDDCTLSLFQERDGRHKERCPEGMCRVVIREGEAVSVIDPTRIVVGLYGSITTCQELEYEPSGLLGGGHLRSTRTFDVVPLGICNGPQKTLPSVGIVRSRTRKRSPNPTISWVWCRRRRPGQQSASERQMETIEGRSGRCELYERLYYPAQPALAPPQHSTEQATQLDKLLSRAYGPRKDVILCLR